MTEIMHECDKYEIKLANDPTVLGPTYLQDTIATCRNYTNHAARLMNEVSRVKMEIDRELRRKQTAFKIGADELLAKNLAVRSLPNIKDRESQINLLLKDEHREIVNLENDLLDISHVEEYIKRRHRELKDTMREIQSQRALIQADRELGGMYGDERPTSMGSTEATEAAYTQGAHARPSDMNEDDINQMLQEAMSQPDTKSQPDDPKEPPTELVPQTEEDKMRAFLDDPIPFAKTEKKASPITSVASDVDFSELLNNL